VWPFDDSSAAIAVSATIVATSSREELQAVIAHECGHIKLQHHTKKLVFGAAIDLAKFISKVSLFINPVMAITSFAALKTLEPFAKRKLSRIHEHAADEFSVKLIDPQHLISQLKYMKALHEGTISLRSLSYAFSNPLILLLYASVPERCLTPNFFRVTAFLDNIDIIFCLLTRRYLILVALRVCIVSVVFVDMARNTFQKRFQKRNITTLVSELLSTHPELDKRIDRLTKLEKSKRLWLKHI
jgi:Zn-dependent protease with chaperone function